jgi:hypothetical protein
MKKLVIFGMAALMLAFSVSLVLANPADFSNDTTGGSTSTSQSSNIPEVISGDSSTSTQAGSGVGDVANGGSAISSVTTSKDVEVTKTDSSDNSGQTNTKDSNNSKSVSITKSDFDTKTIASNNTITKDDSSTNTKTIASNNTITKTDVDQKVDDTKNGSAAAVNGDATVDKSKTVKVDVDTSGSNYLGKTEAEKNIAGSQNAGVGNSATTTTSLFSGNTDTDTKTITKTYTKDSFNTDSSDNSGQTNTKAIASFNSITKDSNNTKTYTKDSYNTKNIYKVDDQVMNATVAYEPDSIPGTPQITQTVNKTWSNTVTDSFNGFTGIGNNAQSSGNFNNTKAVTAFNLSGGVGNSGTTP